MTDQSRQSWIDFLRGVSIVLVILGHAYGFAFDADATAVQPIEEIEPGVIIEAVHGINKSVAPFRMEIMFLLSGLFVHRGLAKGTGRYLQGKINNILYPFIIWSLLSFALRQSGAVLAKGEPLDWELVLEMFLGSAAATWFLYYLFIYYLVAPLVRNLNALAVMGVSLLIALFLPEDSIVSPNLFYFFVYFYAGDYLARNEVGITSRPARRWLTLSLAAVAATFVVANLTGKSSTWPGYVPLVLASVPLIFQAAISLSHYRFAEPFKYIGRHSMVFYLVHFHMYIALAYLLEMFTSNEAAIFFLLFIAGLLVPLCISIARRRESMSFLNVLFSPPRQTATATRLS
ncbi:acyltransferase family protein [Stutzerimonas tarimensis]|uniref:Acyltransferase family protein n=1 Tax=Stutzerimonas tarimensis TaxID=1507735 RepID=A0ABV7T4S6_9GAMM